MTGWGPKPLAVSGGSRDDLFMARVRYWRIRSGGLTARLRPAWAVVAALLLLAAMGGTAAAQLSDEPDYSTGWQRRGAEFDDEIGGVVAGSPQMGFVVLGVDYDGSGLYSTDGVSWEPISLPGIESAIHVVDVAVGDSGFVAIGRPNSIRATGRYSPRVWHSTDGRSWQRIDPTSLPLQELTGGGGLESVRAGPGGFVIVGNSECSEFVWVSADGQTWSETDMASGCWSVEVAPTTTGWVGLRGQDDDLIVTASADGTHWIDIDAEDAPPHNVLAGRLESRRSFVSDGTAVVLAREAAVWVSGDNGRSWINTPLGTGDRHIPMVSTDLGFLGALSDNRLVSSPDGGTWTQHSSDIAIYDLAAAGGTVVAVTANAIYTWEPTPTEPLAATGANTAALTALAVGLLGTGALLIATRSRLTTHQ